MKKPTKEPVVLLDENVDIRIKRTFLAHNISVHVVPKGSTDEEVFELSRTLGAVLLTHDKDFANREFYKPFSEHGVLVVSIHPPLRNVVDSAITVLFQSLSFSDLYGKISVLTPRGIELIE